MNMVTLNTSVNQPIEHMDPARYAGKWYVIGWIPTRYDRNWENTVETYTLNEKGDYDIFTTYRRKGKIKSVRSKGFINKKKGNAVWKVQFVWPFRADYWIIELREDYSYTVVGHPKHKFLFIMARQPEMSESLYDAIVRRCAAKGYDTAKLKLHVQDH